MLVGVGPLVGIAKLFNMENQNFYVMGTHITFTFAIFSGNRSSQLHCLNISTFLSSRQLTEDILTNDFPSTTCFSPQAPSRVRKFKSEHTQYSNPIRESVSSRNNSVDLQRRTRVHSASHTPHSSREILNLTDVRESLEPQNVSSTPQSSLHSRVISNLNAQAREMAGGQPDYV